MVEVDRFPKVCAFIYVVYLARSCFVLGEVANINDGWFGWNKVAYDVIH